MSVTLGDWLAQLLATDAPALPSTLWMQVGLHLGWSVVLAWLGASIMGHWWPRRTLVSQRQRRPAALLACALAAWAWLPGPLGPTHWLGLAFQMPSVVTVWLCAGLLQARFFGGSGPSTFGSLSASSLLRSAQSPAASANRTTLALAVIGVFFGWALLLDTFALLPLQLYAWGFSPAALGLSMLAALLPWALKPKSQTAGFRVWAAPMALLVFAALRLPTGNVWDALLDPWLWLALHIHVVRTLLKSY